MDAFCYTHPGRAPCIVMVDFVSLTTIVPSLLSSYYKSVSLPRQLAPPATRSTWRMPADKALLEARGAFATYWDPVHDRPRESPTKARGGSGSMPNSPRAPLSPRLAAAPSFGAQGGPLQPPPLGLSSLAPQHPPMPAAAAAIAAAGAAAGWQAGGPPPPPPPGGDAGGGAAAAPPPLPATRVA